MYDIIGTGSYSVVIKPYVSNISKLFYESCNIAQQPNQTYVGKIYTEHHKDAFQKELSILKKISDIDGHSDFTVPFIQAAMIDGNELFNQLDILEKLKDINDYKNLTSNLYQLVVGYGGIPISSRRCLSKIKFADFMKLIKQLYVGISKLQSVGIVHRDIKPTNILNNGENLNIIDFSMSCDVADVYNFKDDDQLYIMSYMYMYNPPEFYIASQLFDNCKIYDFQTSLKVTAMKFTDYSKDLEQFYFEHYYRYNRQEPYNIFSYKRAFQEFFNTIIEKNINNIEDIFDANMALKADVYSTYFLLKEFRHIIIFDSQHQKLIFNTLLDMTGALNPYARSNIQQIINFINENMFY